jgi:hypothetical protein
MDKNRDDFRGYKSKSACRYRHHRAMLGKLYAKAVTNIKQAFQELIFTLELVRNYKSETSFNDKWSF